MSSAIAESEQTLFKCHLCGVLKFDIRKFLHHLQLVHDHEPGFNVCCHLCSRVYQKTNSLRQHYKRHHRNDKLLLNCQEWNDEYCDETDDTADESSSLATIGGVVDGLRHHVNLLILKLQEKHVLPHAVQNTVATDVSFIVEYLWSNVSKILSTRLQEEGFHIPQNSDLAVLLGNDNFFEQIFADVSSEHRLTKFAKERLNFVAPKEIVLKPASSDAKKVVFHYISLVETLKVVLLKDDILQEILSDESSTYVSEDAAVGFADGLIFKQHNLFSQKTHCLRLHFYTDEFEVVNPLGSKKGVHKLCAFYFVIGNISAKFNSQLKHIHLCLLAKHSILKGGDFTYADILAPLIKDLTTLQEQGITVFINGLDATIYAGLATISSDNLSAHALAGFSQCFSSGRICRFCLILHDDMSLRHHENECQLRTGPVHQYHIQALDRNASISLATYGVAKHCPFEALEYFSVTEAFPPDIMHDVLEGVIPLLLKLILKSFVTAKYFTVSHFNDLLENFVFGHNDVKCKPVKIPPRLLTERDSGNLPGKAIEKWCLFRILPFLVGDLIPRDNVQWQLYLQFREIAEIMFAPKLDKQFVHYLQLQISEFVSQFVIIFPGKITPKVHYLIHYPRSILRFGPLRHLWCMRFEAKHQYFKRVANIVHNFRNISYTPAHRHQLRQSFEFSGKNILLVSAEGERIQTIQFSKLTTDIQCLLAAKFGSTASSLKDSVVLSCSQLTNDCITFKLKDFFVIDTVEEEHIPVFFKVAQILNCNNIWFLYGHIYMPRSFSCHHYAYCVEKVEYGSVIEPWNVSDYHPLDGYQQNGVLYVSLQHKIVKVNYCVLRLT